jgi:type IV secretory pathway VirJ component
MSASVARSRAIGMAVVAAALLFFPLPGSLSPLPACRAQAFSPEDTLRVSPFGRVTIYRHAQYPAQLVLFVSGDGGWNQGVVDMARELSGLDAAVVGVDITRYLKHLASVTEACYYPAADFENLSKAVQQHLGYPGYITPMLIGYSSGATLVYATLVQAPATTFKGAISLGFCPDLPLKNPLCKGSGLESKPLRDGKGYWFLPAASLEPPWIALQGLIDQVCNPDSTRAFVTRTKNAEIVLLPKVGHGYSVYANWLPQFKEAYRKVAQATPPAGAETKVDSLPDLPLVEVAASGTPRDYLALHITGDGGWGVTDRGLGETLAREGIPVVGLNSLHYFWKARTPEDAARDVAKVLRYYLAKEGKRQVVLIGYSFGADVIPFIVSRMPEDLRRRVALIALLGPSAKADFRFRPQNWLGVSGADALPVKPEVEKLRGMKILCFGGQKDEGSICDDLPPGLVTAIDLKGGHRIGGDFGGIAEEILKTLP